MDKASICYIAGALPLHPALLPQLSPDDYLIAADQGYERLLDCGLTPHLVVGDFDSSTAPHDHPNVLHLPSIKDETDVCFALGQGVERGYDTFIILGALGGALDHTFANLQLLHWLSRNAKTAILAGEGQCAMVLTRQSVVFPASQRGRISVFAIGGDAHGVTLRGLKYPLMDEDLDSTFPLGVSNEFVGLQSRISTREGSLLLIWDNHDDCQALGKLLFTVTA